LLACLERRDRFDIWGMNADILVPLQIPGDGLTYKQDCFRLVGFPQEKYNMILENFKKYYLNNYEILDHLYPRIDGRNYINKNQFPNDKKVYDFKPRSLNKQLLEGYIKTDKPVVCIAPRFRHGFPRNWPYWQRFYDFISTSKELKSYCFVICGKEPDYVPDKLNRFHDINKIKLDSNSSLIGITIELLKRSVLTVGSQSSIPNISLLVGTPTLEWGDQKKFHTIDYNVNGTAVTFIDDTRYQLDVMKVGFEMVKILKEWERKDGKKRLASVEQEHN